MGQQFQTTRWSIVLAARTARTAEAREALSSLCETYWHPLYVYVRRQGYRADEARDLTQGYFLRLMEKDYLKDVTPTAGKFRLFLLVSLKHFLSNERERERAKKRGGRSVRVSMDIDGGEQLYQRELTDTITAERLFERRWARIVLSRVQDRLRAEFERTGREQIYRALEGYLTGGGRQRPYREVAAELEMSETAVRATVLRLRRRFGQLLRAEIAHTVADPDEVDDEIRYLMSVIAD